MTAVQWIAYARKALVAGVAALAQLSYALSPTSDGAGTVTVSEWVAVGMAGLAALGVYAVRNGTAPDGAHEA